MDWAAAIEKNREALKRVLAMLAGLAELGQPATMQASSDGPPSPDCRPSLPRHLYRTILRLLRPAEAAARRLVIVAARGLVVASPPPHTPQPSRPVPRSGVDAGIVMPAGVAVPPPLTPPHKGEGDFAMFPPGASTAGSSAPVTSPSPLWGGVRGGGNAVRGGGTAVRAGGNGVSRPLAFRLFDPLPRRRRPTPSGVPRIWFPGEGDPFPIPRPPSPFDAIDATRLALRLAALARALDDLPRQARRFARWRARRDAPPAKRNTTRISRIWPLRPGRPPGHHAARGRRHEVHEILDITNGLALWALEAPDTS